MRTFQAPAGNVGQPFHKGSEEISHSQRFKAFIFCLASDARAMENRFDAWSDVDGLV